MNTYLNYHHFCHVLNRLMHPPLRRKLSWSKKNAVKHTKSHKDHWQWSKFSKISSNRLNSERSSTQTASPKLLSPFTGSKHLIATSYKSHERCRHLFTYSYVLKKTFSHEKFLWLNFPKVLKVFLEKEITNLKHCGLDVKLIPTIKGSLS